MKVLIIDPLSQNTLHNLINLENIQVKYMPNISESDILKELIDTSVLIMRSSYILTDQWLKMTNTLKMVIVAGNGTENVVTNLSSKNIALKNVKSASITSVAEYTLCLMIMGLRNIISSMKTIKNGEWEKENLLGNEIRHKTIGLVGYGSIGKAIAELLNFFKVNVIYNNKTGLIPNSELEYVDLLELAERSDIVSVQVPLNKETHSLIDDIFLRAMKPNAILINIARYEIINMNDLLGVLRDGRLNHVFIDPLEKRYIEELPQFDNLPITFLPHLGANTLEAQDKIGTEIIKIIKDFQCI